MKEHLSGRTLVQLKIKDQPSTGGNEIKPTKAEVLAIVELMRNGVQPGEIKKQVVREVGGAKLTFSMGQIHRIRRALNERIKELTPEPEVVE